MTSLKALLSCALVASLVPTAGQAGFDVKDKAMSIAAKSAEAAIKEAVKDLFTPDTMSEARVKEAKKHLKKQRKYIEGRKGLRKELKYTLVKLEKGQNYVRIMESLLSCLEDPRLDSSSPETAPAKTILTYNAIADDDLKELEDLRASMAKLSPLSLRGVCKQSFQEFKDNFYPDKKISNILKLFKPKNKEVKTGIRDTVSIDEELPDLTLVNLSYLAIYSEQDVRDLFQYYIAHLNRVILLHENFARVVQDIKRVAKERLQSFDIEIPQEIMDVLERQRKLALYKVLRHSENILARGGENGDDALYTFPRIEELYVIIRYTANTDRVETFMDKDKPYELLPNYPLVLDLPYTSNYIGDINQKTIELGDYIPPNGEDENINLEFEMDQSINEIVAFIDAAIAKAKEEIKKR